MWLVIENQISPNFITDDECAVFGCCCNECLDELFRIDRTTWVLRIAQRMAEGSVSVSSVFEI